MLIITWKIDAISCLTPKLFLTCKTYSHIFYQVPKCQYHSNCLTSTLKITGSKLKSARVRQLKTETWRLEAIRKHSLTQFVCQWLRQQPASFIASGIQKLVDRWDKRVNESGRYIEKWNINVWRLNRFACRTCSCVRFSPNSQRCLTPGEFWRKSNGTLADCVLSTSDFKIMMSFSKKKTSVYLTN